METWGSVGATDKSRAVGIVVTPMAAMSLSLPSWLSYCSLLTLPFSYLSFCFFFFGRNLCSKSSFGAALPKYALFTTAGLCSWRWWGSMDTLRERLQLCCLLFSEQILKLIKKLEILLCVVLLLHHVFPQLQQKHVSLPKQQLFWNGLLM